MKTVGIIAEYNPFHLGHQFQIEKAKQLTGADYVIIVMSGNYVQRGTPAILHKYSRTEMALFHGVDLVLELPVCYATASAEYFAYGAISMFHQLGCIDYLCFGSECGDISVLTQIAEVLSTEPISYQENLKIYLKEGCSFPEARTKALCKHLHGDFKDLEMLQNVLSSPNNILGIEYMKAIKKCKSNIKPITVKREGASYHSDNISETFASATAIRKHLTSIEEKNSINFPDLPSATKSILAKEFLKTYPIIEDDFSTLLFYQLLQNSSHLADYFDVTSDLAHRIQNLLEPSLSFQAFAQILKTKQLTLTRINRALLHILLGITTLTMEDYLTNSTSYARILGLKTESSNVVNKLKRNSSIPIITKMADAKNLLNSKEYSMLQLEINASHLYNQVVYSKYKTKIKDEYIMGPIRM